MAPEDLEGERAAVAAACRRLAERGLVVGTAGNVSVRAGERVAISPTGSALAELAPDHVTVVDLRGRVTAGELEPSSELQLHLALYRSRAEAGAVVHTHAPLATALSCVLDELPCVHYSMLELGGAVRVARYATFGTSELADAVVEALAGRRAALMTNHGAVTLGADLPGAVEAALLLEWACEVYWRAALLGRPRTLDQAQLDAVASAVQDRGYGKTRPASRDAGARREGDASPQ